MASPHYHLPASVRDAYAADCPCRLVLDLLADKWSVLALGALQAGPVRFGEIKTRLEGISPKVLSGVLRRLTEHELITRTVYPVVPLHVEYALTDLGRDACAPLGALLSWVEANIERFPDLPAS
ncbi:winged helix-turn-helix transcriptional regulator [Streptomyces sp. NPDC004096]